MKLFTVALIVACFVVSALATCKWTSPSGKTYDFTATKDSEVIIPSDHLTYSFNFCGGKPSNTLCAASEQGPAQAGCLYEESKFWLVSGRWDNTAANGPATIVERESGGLTLNFVNGGNFPTGAQSRLAIDLDCGKTKTGSYFESMPPNIHLAIQSPLGCPSGSDGLSGGALFLIIFFSVLAGYFVIGFLICKFALKKEGVVQAIPQYQFWCALPGMYVAGIKFTFSKIAGCIGGNKGSQSDGYASSSYGATEEDV